MNVQGNSLAIRRQERGEGTLAEDGTAQSLDAGADGSSLLFSPERSVKQNLVLPSSTLQVFVRNLRCSQARQHKFWVHPGVSSQLDHAQETSSSSDALDSKEQRLYSELSLELLTLNLNQATLWRNHIQAACTRDSFHLVGTQSWCPQVRGGMKLSGKQLDLETHRNKWVQKMDD